MEPLPSSIDEDNIDPQELILGTCDENTLLDGVESIKTESVPPFSFEENLTIGLQQKSEVDLNTILGLESEEYSESKHGSEVVCPLGESYIPLAPEVIEEKKKLLGVIRLYWPVSPDIRYFPICVTQHKI